MEKIFDQRETKKSVCVRDAIYQQCKSKTGGASSGISDFNRVELLKTG